MQVGGSKGGEVEKFSCSTASRLCLLRLPSIKVDFPLTAQAADATWILRRGKLAVESSNRRNNKPTLAPLSLHPPQFRGGACGQTRETSKRPPSPGSPTLPKRPPPRPTSVPLPPKTTSLVPSEATSVSQDAAMATCSSPLEEVPCVAEWSGKRVDSTSGAPQRPLPAPQCASLLPNCPEGAARSTRQRPGVAAFSSLSTSMLAPMRPIHGGPSRGST